MHQHVMWLMRQQACDTEVKEHGFNTAAHITGYISVLCCAGLSSCSIIQTPKAVVAVARVSQHDVEDALGSHCDSFRKLSCQC